jgi:hypothetical protein
VEKQVSQPKESKVSSRDSAAAKRKSKTKRAVSRRRTKPKTTVDDDYDVDTSEPEGDPENSDQEESNWVSFKNLDLTASSSNFVNLNQRTLLAAVPAALVWKRDKRVSLWS